jgi:hypothetical protein
MEQHSLQLSWRLGWRVYIPEGLSNTVITTRTNGGYNTNDDQHAHAELNTKKNFEGLMKLSYRWR